MEGAGGSTGRAARWRGGPRARDPGRARQRRLRAAVGFRLPVVDLLAPPRRGPRRRPPRPRPARPRLGRRRGACAACSPTPDARSATRCSTSATSPASATSTSPRSVPRRGRTRGAPVGDVPDLPRSSRAPALLVANSQRATQITTGDLRRGQQHWVYGRAPASRAGGAARLFAEPTRDRRCRTASPTGARPASPRRLPDLSALRRPSAVQISVTQGWWTFG